MNASPGAEVLLQSLGVEAPQDIDLEAVAWCVGAEVRYEPLQSCEARIIGFGDRAIITIDTKFGRTRSRFSLGHELGHWSHHRGASSICRADEIGSFSNSPRSTTERTADIYAADIIMPWYLFRPAAQAFKKLSFSMVDELGNIFQVSRTAAAIRLIGLELEPSILVCHGTKGRKWFRRSRSVPEHWFPRDDISPESSAFEIILGKAESNKPLPIKASVWFDRRDAERFYIYEQTVRCGQGEVLTFLTFKDQEMLG